MDHVGHSFDRVLPVLFAEPLGGRSVQSCFPAEADHTLPHFQFDYSIGIEKKYTIFSKFAFTRDSVLQ